MVLIIRFDFPFWNDVLGHEAECGLLCYEIRDVHKLECTKSNGDKTIKF